MVRFKEEIIPPRLVLRFSKNVLKPNRMKGKVPQVELN